MTPRRRVATTVALLCGTFLSSLDVTVVATAMPSIASELGGVELYGWVFAAYLLTSTTSMPLYGKLADRWGRRPTYVLGVGTFLVGSIACAAAPTMPLLVAARALQGLGAGAILPLTVTIFGDLYPVRERARLQAVFSLVWGVSSIVGPAVGAVIVELWSWPFIFWINLPIGGAAALVLWLSLREEPPAFAGRMDVAGATLLTLSVLLLLTGTSQLRGGTILGALSLIALALLLALLFVRVERRAQDPIVPLDMYRDAVLAVGGVGGVFLGGLLFTMIAFVPLLVRGVGGGSALAAGGALIPLSFGWTTGSFAAGRAIMRFGYRPVIRIGTFLAAIGAAGIALTAVEGFSGLLLPSAACTGIGMGLTITSFNVVTQDRVPWERRGAASAMLLFSRNMGGTVVVSVLGMLMAALLSDALATMPAAPDPNLLVDPDRWHEIEPAALDHAREALRRALVIVFGIAAISAAIAFVVHLRFPVVHPKT